MDKETLRELKKELDWWWNPGRLWCMERALETARDVMGDETLEDEGLTGRELKERLSSLCMLAKMKDRVQALREYAEADEREMEKAALTAMFGLDGKEDGHGER